MNKPWVLCTKVCSVFVVSAALVACGGSQSERAAGPYSNDLLNQLSHAPPLTGPVPGALPSQPAPPDPVAPTPPEEPDVPEMDATVVDAAPEAGPDVVDAGRRRAAAPARPAPRRDGGR